jgi:serine/threonine/tyrosine protein kinase RAD53
MDYEGDSFSYSQDSEVSTQQTQSTQQLTQPVAPPLDRDAHLWGYLLPVNDKLTRIDFWREQRQYTVGRNTELNKIVFPGFKVSKCLPILLSLKIPSSTIVATGNRHCEITWSAEDTGGTVLVLDLSSNGTYVSVRSASE